MGNKFIEHDALHARCTFRRLRNRFQPQTSLWNYEKTMLIKIVALFRNLLISSFDASIRVKRAFHPALASRGFASHVFLVKKYINPVTCMLLALQLGKYTQPHSIFNRSYRGDTCKQGSSRFQHSNSLNLTTSHQIVSADHTSPQLLTLLMSYLIAGTSSRNHDGSPLLPVSSFLKKKRQ